MLKLSAATYPRSEIYRELMEEVRQFAELHVAGKICESTFVQTLLAFEAEKAAAHGLILTASNTFDDWTVVILRAAGNSKPVAALEFNAHSGAFRPVTIYVGQRVGTTEWIE